MGVSPGKLKYPLPLLTPITNFYNSMLLSWVVYGGSPSYQYPCYYQTADGMVHLSGAMKSGTNGVFYTMPAGLRPGNKLAFGVNVGASGSGSEGRLIIDNTGALNIQTADNTFVSLDGISWLAQN